MKQPILPGQGLYPTHWDADIDYVRLICKPGDENERIAWLFKQAGHDIASSVDGESPTAELWAALGVRGVSYGNIQTGTGNYGHLYQASGWAAAHTRHVALPWDTCSRCDVQVTLWYPADNAEQVRVWANRAHTYSKSRGSAGRAVRLIEGYERGATTTIGVRTSDRYIRIYDKARESRGASDYANALRCEIEYKGTLAGQIWQDYGRPGVSPLAYAALVHKELRAAGLLVPGLQSAKAIHRPVRPMGETTNESKLSWLAHQVRPAVEKLRAAGYSEMYLRELLGLDNGREW